MTRSRPTILVTIALAALSGKVAEATDLVPPSAWIRAVEISGVPSDILFAMSLKESGTTFKGKRAYGPWPWVLNVREKAYFFGTREEAEDALAAEVKSGNDRVAVGMYQIYLKYNGARVEDVQDLIDPTINLLTAAEVLKDCGDRYPAMEEKLSCYYSGNVDQAGIDYADGVFRLAEKYGEPFVLRQPRTTLVELRNPETVEISDHNEFLAMIQQRVKRPTRRQGRMIVVSGTE